MTQRDQDTAIRELVDRFFEMLPDIDDRFRNQFWTRLQALGILKSWQEGDLLESIVRRLEDNKIEKQNLGRYARKLHDLTDRRLFMESGSTLAHIALGISTAEKDLPRWILTNNFLVQLIFFGRLDVPVTRGPLRKTYLAYLPFGGGGRGDEEPSKHDLVADTTYFNEIKSMLADPEIAYVTSSTFGFLVGPLVGTRDNAIFKYCLFNSGLQNIRLCIAAPKLFHAPQYGWETGREGAEESAQLIGIREHIERKCFLVFGIERQETVGDAPRHALDANALLMTNLELAEAATSRGIRAAPHELGLKLDRGNFEGPGIRASASWLSFLDAQASRGRIEILVGCSSDSDVEQIKAAANEASRMVTYMGKAWTFAIESDRDHVVHCVVK